MNDSRLIKEEVLRIGEVSSVMGRRISISVDKEKNLSELFFDGDLLKNVAVGSYIDIRKGFLSLIGKVAGEVAQFESSQDQNHFSLPNSKRVLTISLVGFLDKNGKFYGGTKELPLVGNEAFLLTKEKVHKVHNLIDGQDVFLEIANSEYEGYEIALPVDGLMNSHIAIFGNTGSGKSNTLAVLYEQFISKMRERNVKVFESVCKVIIFDFNGEYTRENCITKYKHVYNLSTYSNGGDKIPLGKEGLLDIEMLSVLADATEKTQKPFLNRALRQMNKVRDVDNSLSYAKNIIRQQVTKILQVSDKSQADLLLDYLRQILPKENEKGDNLEIAHDIQWNNTLKEFMFRGSYLKSKPSLIVETFLYKLVESFYFYDDVISDFIVFCYIQLINDILSNRAQNEHIAPVINKLNSKQASIRKIFDPRVRGDLFKSNVIVISLNDVNLEMKKTIPLLICRKIYHDHKRETGEKSLNIVIDEAHNILSHNSFRESEGWKDYRLETFEEIVKEGRKFGVFITISSQRPSDISSTITSQAHNYFIHRLINQKDLQSIATAVSYIDEITEESIPTLTTGTCIFSGIAGQMPLKLAIKPLDENSKPKSMTLMFSRIVPKSKDDETEVVSFL